MLEWLLVAWVSNHEALQAPTGYFLPQGAPDYRCRCGVRVYQRLEGTRGHDARQTKQPMTKLASNLESSPALMFLCPPLTQIHMYQCQIQ